MKKWPGSIGVLTVVALLPTGCGKEKPSDKSAAAPEPIEATSGGEEMIDEIELDAALSEVNRYQLYPNAISEGMRDHFLVDTATGSVWCAFIPAVDDMFAQVRTAATHWVPIPVQPAPEFDYPESGRFTLAASFSYGADKFLLDTVSGRVWCRLATDQGGFVFQETPVQRPAPSSQGAQP